MKLSAALSEDTPEQCIGKLPENDMKIHIHAL